MHKALSFIALAAALAVATPVNAQATPALNTSPVAQANAEKLANDSTAYDACLKSPAASPDNCASAAAAVNADLTLVSADQGTSSIAIPSKKYLMFFSIGGAGGISAAPFNKSLSLGAIAGLDLDFGFGTLASGQDHWHVSLVVGATNLSSLTTGKTVGAVAVSLLPGYQPSSGSPIYSFGPAMFCPVDHGWCVFGAMFSTSLAGTVAKAGFNVSDVPTS